MVDYCTLTQIKERLEGIADTDTAYDTELGNIRDDIEADIDNILQNHTTTPLTSVPTKVAKIAADLCAIEFRMRRAPSSDAAQALKTLRDTYWADLEIYCSKTYAHDEIALVVGTDTSD